MYELDGDTRSFAELPLHTILQMDIGEFFQKASDTEIQLVELTSDGTFEPRTPRFVWADVYTWGFQVLSESDLERCRAIQSMDAKIPSAWTLCAVAAAVALIGLLVFALGH